MINEVTLPLSAIQLKKMGKVRSSLRECEIHRHLLTISEKRLNTEESEDIKKN